MLVAVIGPDQGHPQWPGICGGAQRYAVAVPTVRVVCMAPDTATVESFHQTTKAALERRPNAVCLFIPEFLPHQEQIARGAIDGVSEHQALLVTMGLRTGDTRVYGHVGVLWADAAERLGVELRRIAAGRQSYLLLYEEKLTPLGTVCYQRFSGVTDRRRDLTLLQERGLVDGGPAATDVVAEMLALFPNAGLLVTLNPDLWWRSTPEQSHALRRLNHSFRFVTLSAAPTLWRRLGTSTAPGDAAALVGPLDGQIGYLAVQMAMRGLIGEQETSKSAWVPCEIVTPEGLPDFARRYSEAAGGLDVPRYLGTPALSTPPSNAEP